MARGFTWCVYETDPGILFALQVDSDSAQDPNRGWLSVGVDTTNPFPRGWRPRHVVGIDETGRTQRTRIGRVDAALWLGTVLTWEVETNDGGRLLVTRIGRVGERTRPFPSPD